MPIYLFRFKRAFNVVGIESTLRLQPVSLQVIGKFPVYADILFFDVQQRDIRYQFLPYPLYVAGDLILITGNVEYVIHENDRQDIIVKVHPFEFDRIKKSEKVLDIVESPIDIFKRGFGFAFGDNDILCLKYEFFIEFDV